MTGGNTAKNTVTVNGGTGDVNVTMTGGNTGDNKITVSGSGTDTVVVGQHAYTIDLSGTTGSDTITIGNTTSSDNAHVSEGINTITFGSGDTANTLNFTTIYPSNSTSTPGANTLTLDATSGATNTLVFTQSATTSALWFDGAKESALNGAGSGTISSNTIAQEITLLNASGYAGAASGDSSVGWINNDGGSNPFIVMAHYNGTSYIDQVIQITGTAASSITGSTGLSVSSGLVHVAL
jgi:hypothetical protein